MRRLWGFRFVWVCFLSLLLSASSGVHLSTAAALLPPARFTFLDVGQGDAILLEDGTGLAFLMDGGPPSAGTRLQTVLAQRNIVQLQAIVATHPDRDHIGGLIALLQTGFPVQTILYTGLPNPADIWAEFQQTAADHSIPLLAARTGDSFLWGNLEVMVLNPPLLNPPSDDNRACLVLRVRHGTLRALLTCDIDSQTEERLMLNSTLLPAEILKVSHHGSDTASSSAFLHSVSPRVAILSVGSNNAYGHPAPAVLTRLGLAAIPLWRTDTRGDISLTSNGQSYVISSSIPPPLYLPLIQKQAEYLR